MYLLGTRKRISWKMEAAEVDLGDRVEPILHQMKWTHRFTSRWIDGSYSEEAKWVLGWGGQVVDSFATEVEVKLYIIRFAYGIEPQHLVPSELLADAGLWYTTGDWVDDWKCTDQNNEIDEIPDNVSLIIPKDRRIRLAKATEKSAEVRTAKFLRLHRGSGDEKPHLRLVEVEKEGSRPKVRIYTKPIPADWEDFSPGSRVYSYGRFACREEETSDEGCLYKLGEKAKTAKKAIIVD